MFTKIVSGVLCLNQTFYSFELTLGRHYYHYYSLLSITCKI